MHTRPPWAFARRFRLCLGLGIGLAGVGSGAVPSRPASTITFVANAENQTRPRVRYTGREWTADQGGFLVSPGRGHRLLTALAAGPGDFRIELDLSLPRAGRESALVVGTESEVVIASGAKRWKLKGRFFRAGDAPIEIGAPEIKPGRNFNLVLERNGETATLSVDGTVIHRGPCSVSALGMVGVEPDAGLVHLYTLAVTGVFPDAGMAPKPFGNTFGMQLRPPPPSAREVWAPAIVREAPSNECALLARRDGALELYSITKPESDSASVTRSRDGGLTWNKPEVAFRLPGRAYYALVVLEGADGALHAAYHVQGEGPGGYRGRLYEVYHTQRPAGAATWLEPRRVVPGYVGSIHGFIQLSRSGRLLLAVGRAIPDREQAPQRGPDFGWNDTFVYLSDNQGTTWRQSSDVLSLELATTNVTRYGAIEPVLLELRDGRVWILVRDRGGRLWQSFSADGEHWPALARSPFISSDSPADLLRLRDGRIVLLTNACLNWTDPRSYAMGGREVLHAAISADEGRTWRGFREILHETNIVSGGDRGTAYASMAENPDGKVVVVSGQGEGKRAIVMFDPGWLEENAARNDLSLGPVEWTQYGDDGLQVEKRDDGIQAVAIPLKSSGLCGALWNFAMADTGEIRLRLRVPPEATDVRLCLNDHFNRIDDLKAAEHAVFAIDWATVAPAVAGKWQSVTLKWSDAQGEGAVEIEVDGQPAGRIPAQRPAQFGVNYLRVEFRATSDQGRVLLSELSAQRLR